MFVVFEGIDGCGKTTQLWKLAKYLSSLDKHNHILTTREPYKDIEIRKILNSDEPAHLQKEKLTQLFIEDRKKHIEELIKPSLKKNIIVISDRYKYSTIAYQSAQGQDINHLIEIQKEFPIPDFVFVINTSTEIAMKRIKSESRKIEQKFEKNKEFLESVRKNYLEMGHLLQNEKIIIINGEETIEEIFKNIKKYF